AIEVIQHMQRNHESREQDLTLAREKEVKAEVDQNNSQEESQDQQRPSAPEKTGDDDGGPGAHHGQNPYPVGNSSLLRPVVQADNGQQTENGHKEQSIGIPDSDTKECKDAISQNGAEPLRHPQVQVVRKGRLTEDKLRPGNTPVFHVRFDHGPESPSFQM